MPRLLPWLLAGLLVAGAAMVAFRDRGASPPTAPGDDAATATDVALNTATDATETVAPSRSSEAPQGLSARLLSDSDGARRNLFGMTIREAGHDCPDVRSVDALDRNGHAWRANCGDLRIYWIEIDEFGRMSVEPGSYDDSGSGVEGPGVRTITIQPNESEQLQEVR